MREHQGYFSLIQYSEYPERAEFVNIGVVLFADVSPFVFSKFVERPSRVERVFRSNPGVHFRNIRDSLKDRLALEFARGWNRDSVDRFIELRSGKVRLLPARSIFVESPQDAVKRLFDDLVGELPQQTYGRRAGTKLKEQLRLQGVEGLLQKPDPILLPSGVEVKAAYGYQNGNYNLIKAVTLDGGPDHALEKASPHMIEGRLLFDATRAAEQKKLVIVGDVDELDSDFVNMVADQMERHDVTFYRLDEIGPLIVDIRKNAAIR
ncbi:DUF3037 domain-containing protein [Mesorhizobium sp. AR07]|uniref:DUF3037 domain-containing protein n=1 Tax=Mesorhizobium sp. AR07 TaxID=2865838 RepID=UPI00215E741A|nr:DUF3037 domain-containing protein [Mesorhizobium sp. AR07]UVK43273.1 DUF3037 domain-containing protein [Mesorhizobium sp. AR07]